MADERIRYILDVDDNGTVKLVRFGEAGERAGRRTAAGMNEAGRAMSSTLPTVQSVTDAMGRQVAQLRAQRDAMRTDQYRALISAQRELNSEIERMSGRGGLSAMFGGLINPTTMLLGATAAAVAFGKSVFDATAEMQSLRMGLTAVMGSSARATIELEKLREVAKLPGLGYSEAIKMSTSLQASGMSADMARKAMLSFGNALAVVGKGKAELEGVGLALSQIMSKGKVSAEEINQIAERVPQIRVAMQAAFGTASTEMIQAMGLTSKEFISGITAELGKLDKATGGLKNGAENLSDAWFDFKQNLGGTGSLFDSILQSASAAIGGINSLVTEARKNAKAGEIAEAMAIIKLTKEKQEKARKDASYAAWVGDATRKEWDATLAHYRGVLAKIKAEDDALAKARDADKAKDPEAEKVAMVQEAIRRETKATRAQELAGLDMLYKTRRDNAKSSATVALEVDDWYRKRKAEINSEWDKKDVAGKKKDPAESKALAAERAAVKAHEQAVASNNATTQRMQDAWAQYYQELDAMRAEDRKSEMAAEMQAIKDNAAQIKDANEQTDRMAKFWADYNEEVYQSQKARQDQIVSGWMDVANQTQGVWSSALFEMGKTNGDFYDTLSEGFTAMLGKMAADLAANAIMFGILSLIPGAGAAGAASQMANGGGLFGAIINSFDTGTKSVNGDQIAKIHNGETIFPRPVSEAARAGDWRPAMAFMGQGVTNYGGSTYGGSTSSTSNSIGAIHIHIPESGADPQAIASAAVREIRRTLTQDVAAVQVRASKVQSRTRAGGSF